MCWVYSLIFLIVYNNKILFWGENVNKDIKKTFYSSCSKRPPFNEEYQKVPCRRFSCRLITLEAIQ